MVFWASTLPVLAQSVRPFQVQWHKNFAGTSNDHPFKIAVAPDGGYAVLGLSDSGIGGDKTTTNFGTHDAWLVRLDSLGNKLWERNFGGASRERMVDLKASTNGGWILVGESDSSPSGNKASPNYGDGDYWVVRLDDQGNILWEKSYGGSSYDEAVAVIEAGSGDFIVVGYSYSGTNEIKTLPSVGMADLWILRLTAQGDIIWQTNYGTISQEWPYDIDRRGTNGFVIASSSPPGGTYASANFWILAIDQDGRKLWEHSYGGDGTDEPFNIRQTMDGGFVVSGWTSHDGWIIRLNAGGEKLWERTFGDEDVDIPTGLLQTLDGGFVVSGASPLVGGWVVRLDQSGNRVWEDNFDVGARSFEDVQSTADGGVIAAGVTWSDTRQWDFLVVKLGPDTLTAPQLELLRPLGTPSQLILRGIAGRTYVTQGTEDFLSWLSFATNTLSSNSVELLDQTPGSAKRFYRAMMLP